VTALRRTLLAFSALALLAACGLTTPTFPEGDLAQLQPPESPNWWFVCPPGLCAAAKAEAPTFAMSADDLLALVRRVAAQQPRTTLVAERAAERRIDYVQLTRILRFVDSISTAAVALPDGRSGLIIYSHSNLGRSDMGANRARVEEWLAAITTAAR
jgi:uncharacterized protein (DUF1499 family)